MLDIIAVSYKNIWPFKWNPLSIFFQKGNYLIKAPIGTGKSFLFFDWPMYGLYKYNTRNILNNKSNEWFIKIIFSFEDETWLITRQITKAKIKESCSSNLYKIENYTTTEENILKYNEDIEDSLKKSGCLLEKIDFKNETDLQQTFLSFLPPKEVFVNTVFLMQDSDNIFELIPSERLTVLKNVFWLLGIDEAKEIIAEKKKEINYKIKSYSDNSKYNEKIRYFISNLLSNHQKIEQEISQEMEEIKTLVTAKRKTLEEIKFIEDKITIQDLDISNFWSDINKDINNIIQNKKNEQIEFKNQIENISNWIKAINSKLDNKRQNLFIINNNNQELDKNIKNIEENNFEKIKKEIENSNNQLHRIDETIPYEKIKEIWQIREKISELQEYKNISNIHWIEELYIIIKQLIEKWKSLQEKIKNNQLIIQNKQLEQKNNEEKYILWEKAITAQYNSLMEQLKEIQNHIKVFEQNIEQQSIFSCEKIKTNCPYIKLINKKNFDQLYEQQQWFIKKQKTLEDEINKKEKELSEFRWSNIQKTNNNFKEFETNIKEFEEAIQHIKDFFNIIEWKNIETQYSTYISIKKLKIIKETEINELEKKKKQKEIFIQELEKNKSLQKLVEQEILEYQQEISNLQKEQNEIKEKNQNTIYEKLIIIERYNNNCIIIQRDIENLIKDFKNIQRETEILKQQEKKINNLYTIFSKELLLLVLQDHLPILNDIINNYLSQIVDYQLDLKLNRTNNDKLELEANITDEQGERDIKSLSWWQRTLLKLIWMLAISSYMRSPILFLDETINNLDQETVSKVTDMLENFTQERNIKFYTVTHNQQIQEMQIRDRILEIQKEKNLK